MKHFKQALLYWIPTGLLLLCMVGSAVMYFLQPAQIAQVFTDLGYPVYSMYFNAIAKILGAIAIVTPVPRFLKEFAYAGYLYIMLLALQAIYLSDDGLVWPMFMFLALWGLSYWQWKKRAA